MRQGTPDQKNCTSSEDIIIAKAKFSGCTSKALAESHSGSRVGRVQKWN